MAKETCNSCDAKLPARVSFCPSCEHPTRYASDSERLEWDLKQWRAHVDRSVARGMTPDRPSIGFGDGGSVALAARAEPGIGTAPVAKPHIVPVPETRKAPKPSKPTRGRLPMKVRFARTKRIRPEPARVLDLDRDNEFAYDRCATCSERDWIVRYGRNDDETYNYWCVRCSRSFKTEVRLHQAFKPFLSSGVVVGSLIAASTLLLR